MFVKADIIISLPKYRASERLTDRVIPILFISHRYYLAEFTSIAPIAVPTKAALERESPSAVTENMKIVFNMII